MKFCIESNSALIFVFKCNISNQKFNLHERKAKIEKEKKEEKDL